MLAVLLGHSLLACLPELLEQLGSGALAGAVHEVEDCGALATALQIYEHMARLNSQAYTPQHSPHQPCRSPPAGAGRARRTRRSGA